MSVFSIDGRPNMILRFPARTKQFIKHHIADQAIEVITWLVGIFSVATGTSLIAGSMGSNNNPPFSLNFNVAPPHVWGFLFLFLGAWVVVTLVAKSEPKLPCYFIGMLAGVWGLLTVQDMASGAASASAFIAYTSLGSVAFVCGIAHEDFDEEEILR